jgi:DNA-binding MarR family transcriptional regulator
MATASLALERQLYDFVLDYDSAFERAAEDHGLSPAQACTLAPLTHRDWTMSELAEELRCDASNVTQIVGRLEARGLVTREPDPGDKRVKRVAITPAGRKLRAAVDRSFTFPREALDRLQPDEREQLEMLLTRMRVDM